MTDEHIKHEAYLRNNKIEGTSRFTSRYFGDKNNV